MINSLAIFNCLLSEEKESLVNALIETTYIKNETIIRESKRILLSSSFILEGSCMVLVATRG